MATMVNKITWICSKHRSWSAQTSKNEENAISINSNDNVEARVRCRNGCTIAEGLEYETIPGEDAAGCSSGIMTEPRGQAQPEIESPPQSDDMSRNHSCNVNLEAEAFLLEVLQQQLAPSLGSGRASCSSVTRHKPMVISFHDLSLSVVCINERIDAPPWQHLSNCFGNEAEADASKYVFRSFEFGAEERNMGCNVEREASSGLAFVKRVLPGSWAHRVGVK
jgi:hypothetical protein